MSKEVSSREQSLKFALKTEVERKNLPLFSLPRDKGVCVSTVKQIA